LTTKFWLWQGEASYSLYLVHPLVLQMTRKVLDRWVVDGSLGFVLRLVVLLGACAIGGALFYNYVERRLNLLLTRRSPRSVKGAVESSG